LYTVDHGGKSVGNARHLFPHRRVQGRFTLSGRPLVLFPNIFLKRFSRCNAGLGKITGLGRDVQ
jgi:hypothetical protein